MHTKIEVKMTGGDRLRPGEVNIMLKRVPNLKTGQLKEAQRAGRTQRYAWVLLKPVGALQLLFCCGLGHGTPFKALVVIPQNLGNLSRISLLLGIAQELVQSGTPTFHPIDAGSSMSFVSVSVHAIQMDVLPLNMVFQIPLTLYTSDHRQGWISTLHIL